jgi:hypothetical protein
MPDREKVRDEFEKRLREIIKERKIDLIAEEAGDDTAVWENLRREDVLVGEEYAELFGGGHTVEAPVPTIAKKLAVEHGVRHEDIDVDVRADENDEESIKKRDEAMTWKILDVLKDGENVLVIVGERHRTGVVERLKKQGFNVESAQF